ncbi:hypothetical protein VSX61_14930 [Brenneria populi subsp. brevivirga]|uniref:tail fiber/spike domain-containing protein n=1 Tax=Brenneria populi TaxID=1505588 RepID=UPI002E182D7D|nr:hypothetical protein [Brenneria populi subsp. brevivirga]
MATTPTNNPVPSESPRDLKFNAGKIDEFVTSIANTYIDRLGGDHYTIEGLTNLVKQIVSNLGLVPFGTFEAGATLENGTQTLKADDGNYYRWDGDFPKSVPSGSTPEATGGIARGAWVNVTDATLRANLGSSEDGLGGSLVSLSGAGTVQDALKNIINVEAFKGSNASSNDWGPAFRAAISYAKNSGGGIVRFSGHYKITSLDSVGWVLPFDDGSIDPSRISAGTDSALDAEEQTSMGVHLNLPSGVSLVGDGVETSSLTFGWDWGAKIINTEQSVGICLRVNNWDGTYIAAAGAKNRMMSVVVNSNVGNFKIKNAFIPIVIDGILVYGEWRELAFDSCAFSLLSLGAEMPRFVGFKGDRILTGPIFGGWWLQRNELEYQGGVKVPPYISGTDIYSLGWCDSVKIGYIKFDFPYWSDPAYADSYVALDKFFDDYIWKTRNSMRSNELTPTGEAGTGRLSVKGSDYTTTSSLQSKNPFRGVSTRALSIIPRYNRGNSGNKISDIKTRGTSRPPVLVGPSSPSGSVVSVDNAFIERSCLANMALTSNLTVGGNNDWFSVGGDAWNADIIQTPYYVGQNLVTTNIVSQAACIAAMPSQSNQSGNGSSVNTIVGPNKDSTPLSRTTLYDPSTGQWTLARESYKNHDYIPRIRFSNDDEYSAAFMFAHAEKILDPGDIALFSLVEGAYSLLTPTSLSCKMFRIGSIVKCYIKFRLSSSNLSNSQFIIGLRRYSVYDTSKGGAVDFSGSRPLLSIYRGSFSSDNTSPKTLEYAGLSSVSGISYHMFKVFSDFSAAVIYPINGMTTANEQSWMIEYESFSNIDAISLS